MSDAWQRALAKSPEARAWRGLDELLEDPRAVERLANEFPDGATDASGFSRRRFLALLGASAGLAGAACTQPTNEVLLPYSETPMRHSPGKRLHFATMMTLDGFAIPLLATSLDGRPIKLDGHPEHPATLGASDAITQAAILDLYDPRRARAVRHRGWPSTWSAFESTFVPKTGDGEGLALLLEPTSSELTASLLARIRQRLPKVRVFRHTPFESPGIKQSTGPRLQARYELSKAEVILTLDADLLGVGPAMHRYARAFAERRKVSDPPTTMNRLYAVEPTLTVTGMTADHRLAIAPSRIAHVAEQLVRALRDEKATPADPWIRAIVADLKAHRGASLIAAGDRQPVEVQALAHEANELLGNIGKTLLFTRSPLLEHEELESLTSAIHAGEINKLVILGGDPAYANRPFADAIEKVQHVACMGLFENETSAKSDWQLPELHFLEGWSDARSFEGIVTFAQPLIEPLYDGRGLHDLLAMLAGDEPQRASQRMRAFWTPRLPGELTWERAVQQGMLNGTELPTVTPVLARAPSQKTKPVSLELDVRPDAKVYDGRFATNAWLQELPDPVTKQTWGNAALVSPALAAKHGLDTGRLVRLTRGSTSVEAPVYVLPGQADDAVTLAAGYGKQDESPIGVNAFLLGPGPITLEPLDGSVTLAITQEHWSTSNRPIALDRTLEEYRRDPHIQVAHEPLLQLYPPPEHPGPQWGMAIDLTTCTGCSACVVACQSENNIPVVGPEGVIKSREMHWIRIDRYFSGAPSNPLTVTQPMLCQHCEMAPCEYVCPVNATTHSPDGLNEMTYNRCVGTRFCSNNCPYKVRRFNWFDYHAHESPTLELHRNDQVTVRARGVMEKCTFCVQRIRNAEIEAKRERVPFRADVVKTACQEACPTQAIVFGDLTDPASAVSEQFRQGRAYQELEELGTRPRVRYLARIRNPNPELES